jgi:nucleotide-binding universal stress UspA family protein
MKRIVVGVDGSDGSVAALRWALAEAEIRGAEVEAVLAWQVPVPALMYDGMVPPPADIDYAAEAEEILARSIKAATGGADPLVPVHRSVPSGPSAANLVAASKGAGLLVVGSRGHGGFAGLLLGSVSQQCAHHAHCPVVIVHGAAR